MIFYRIDAKMEYALTAEEMKDFNTNILDASDSLFDANYRKNLIFVSHLLGKGDEVAFGAVFTDDTDVSSEFEKMAEELETINFTEYKVSEITFSTLSSLLTMGNRNFYVEEDVILSHFHLDRLSQRNCRFGEKIIKTDLKKGDLLTTADKLLLKTTLGEEIKRIYSNPGTLKPVGHPVQYMVTTSGTPVGQNTVEALLCALYQNGRIKNKRYSFIDYDEQSTVNRACLNALYKSSIGGTVVIRYVGNDESEDEFASRGPEVIEAISKIAQKYKNEVLTIISLDVKTASSKEMFLSYWGTTRFIDIYEDVAFDEIAKNYLSEKAKDAGIKADKNLYSPIKENQGYTKPELNNIFNNWYDNKLCKTIYPQYKDILSASKGVAKTEHKGGAYLEFQQLIGLSKAKELLEKSLNYFKAQALFKSRGLIPEAPCMHMVFTGNPGTAKTTVARLFAKILKENGIISNDEILEVGRADLIGRYVGHTAPLVKKAFSKARGGVLFIDEAYSLVDGKEGLFGDEAINTIVQEMENHRKDTIVIFAGYPDKMEDFLSKNPGLKSRIAFHIPFDDYSAKELVDIADKIAHDKGFTLSGNAKEKLNGLFTTAAQSSDFGNGRYARNLIERAKLEQANRLLQADIDALSSEDIFTLTDTDITDTLEATPQKLSIGF